MPRRPKAIVLDSWAIMAYLEDEPSAEKVANIIADSNDRGTPLLMTVVNLGEVWYIIARQTSEQEAERSVLELLQLGIKAIDADWELARQAAYFKSKYAMSYADSFAAALAKHHNAQVITGDKEFRQVGHEVFINWI